MKYVARDENGPYRDVDAGDGLTISVNKTGDGPAVVLLHGFTGSTETWSHLRQKLEHAYSVIAVDLPGHGRSSSPPDPQRYKLSRFSSDLAHVFDSLGVDRAVLLGYSMGGRAALRFAIDHQDRLAGLILESTSPGIADPAQREERRASDAALADDIEREGIEPFVKKWEELPLWDTQRALPSSTSQMLHLLRLCNNPVGLANSLRGSGAAEDDEVLSSASSIRVPTLLIAGALDAKYVGLARQMEQSIARSRLEIIANAGHAVHLERAHGFAAVVMSFLSSIPSAADRWT